MGQINFFVIVTLRGICAHLLHQCSDKLRAVVAYSSIQRLSYVQLLGIKISINKSSAVAEMGDCGRNRHGPKRGGAVPLSRSAGNPSNTMWSAQRSILPYQVASSSIQPFGHNSVGCQSLRRNISTIYYFVVEMHTVTVRSNDARYLLKNSTNCLV